MDRSLAAPARPRIAPRPARGTSAVLRPVSGAARLARAGLAFVWWRRRLRFALLALLVALPLLCGGWLWLRESPLVSVKDVRISGVHGPDARAIDAALEASARRMSTLDVHTGALLQAVARYRVVRAVHATPSVPHGLRIRVSEQLPVAVLVVPGSRTAVAADGVVLGAALLSSSLPTVAGSHQPAPGRRVTGTSLLGALAVLGAAPAALARLVESVSSGPRGLTVAMRGGLLAYFGDASRPHAKWLSLARVLADTSSAGASYVDVRVPARPAAGFPAGMLPPAQSAAAQSGSSETSGASGSPVASLAAGLTAGSGETSGGSGASGEASSPSGETAPASEPEGG
jgi:cell division protein FtsQ